MGKKLSVTAGARRLSLRPLVITAMLVAGFAITASVASAARGPRPAAGSWTVRPGQTLLLTDLRIEARSVVNGPFDTDTAYICVDMICDVAHPLLTNALSTDGSAHLDSFSHANPAHTMTHTVTLDLHDSTNVCDNFSDGGFPGAFVTTFRGISFLELRDGNLSQGGCGRTSGNAEFLTNVQVIHTP